MDSEQQNIHRITLCVDGTVVNLFFLALLKITKLIDTNITDCGSETHTTAIIAC